MGNLVMLEIPCYLTSGISLEFNLIFKSLNLNNDINHK